MKQLIGLGSLLVICCCVQIQAQADRVITANVVRRQNPLRKQNSPVYGDNNESLRYPEAPQLYSSLSNVQYLNAADQSVLQQRSPQTNEQFNPPNYNYNLYQPVASYNANSYNPVNEHELNQYSGPAPKPTVIRVTTTTQAPPVQPNLNNAYPELSYTNPPLYPSTPQRQPSTGPSDQNQSSLDANPLSYPEPSQGQQYQPAGSRQPVNPAPSNVNQNKYEFIKYFSWSLFKNSKTQLSSNSNIVISPLSVQLVLSLIEQASAGRTKSQLQNIIGNSSPVDIGQAVDQVTYLRSKNKLKIGSAIFPSHRLVLNQTFQHVARDSFVDVIPVDYNDQATARHTIDSWASASTANKITSIFSGAQPNTDLLLTNAVYFEGVWKYPFNKTVVDKFFQGGNYQKDVTYLKQTANLLYGIRNYKNININWVELPYENDDFSMLILLPNDFKLDELVDKLTVSSFAEILSDVESGEKWRVHLRLPKFEMSMRVPLKSILQSMGVVDVFSENANIPYLAHKRVLVSDAQQDVYLSVDEKGTTAAAVTTFSVITLSSSSYEPEEKTFDVNQPFLAVILHKQTRLPIFIAKIFDP